jgi:DNA-directed RNA polymerase specialized sigma24 family protein
MPTDDGSVTLWISDLKAGDTAAAQPLWDRYFDRLVSLARARLRVTRRPGAVEDEEDAALSAFDSLCAGAARGRFPNLADRDDLWRILVVITARKVVDQRRRHGRQKRGGGKLAGESVLPGFGDDRGGLGEVIGREPTPEFAAQVAEEHGRLLEALGDDTLRRIALWKMEGHTSSEIAGFLGCALRTVNNKLKLIRRTWLAEGTP